MAITRSITICLVVISLIVTGCSPKAMKPTKAMLDRFEAFKAKDKFGKDSTTMYPGVLNPSNKVLFASKMNEAADDFKEVAFGDDPTDEKYQQKIKLGLSRFPEHLDSEDQERICHYYE